MEKAAPPDDLFMIAETYARDTSLLPDEEQHFDPPLRGHGAGRGGSPSG